MGARESDGKLGQRERQEPDLVETMGHSMDLGFYSKKSLNKLCFDILFLINLTDVKLLYNVLLGYPGATSGKDLPANVGHITDMGSIPGSGRSPRGGHGSPLQYSCLEDPYGQRKMAN